MKSYEKFILYKNKFIRPQIDLGLKILDIISYLASVVFMVSVVFSFGYDTTEVTDGMLLKIYRSVWWIFLLDIILHWLFSYQDTRREYKKVTWLLSTLFLMTLVPIIFKRPEEGSGVLFFWELMNSSLYKTSLLFIISFFNLSSAIVKLLGKKTNPGFILAISFIIIILIGAGLLTLPNCTVNGISWIDSLFVATSAVCVTGLSPVDIPSTFTPLGLTVIITLIQIGGLGVMTFTSFFAIFFMGNTSYSNHLVINDMINSKSLNSLLSTLGYILLFTIVIEGIGALAIWHSIRGSLNMSINDEIAFSIFHSISAFCNAGFSSLPDGLANPMVINKNEIFIYLSFLIILGGVGFPLLVNLKDILRTKIQRIIALIKKKKPPYIYRLTDLNTRIVIATTAFLLIASTIIIGLLEWNGVLANLSVGSKVVKSFFLATCPRSAGFSFYDLNLFQVQTLMLYVFLMWVGGASQSTAGGVKVNTLAVVYLNIVSLIKRTDRIEVYGRQVSYSSVQRAHGTIVMSIVALAVVFILLTIFEPDMSLRALALEAMAALSTCGAGLGVTSEIGTDSKFVLIFAMLLGRVGVITIMLGLVKQNRKHKYEYPSGEIIIN